MNRATRLETLTSRKRVPKTQKATSITTGMAIIDLEIDLVMVKVPIIAIATSIIDFLG